VVLPKGRQLRPQDLGVLSSIGVAEAETIRRPRVRILVTGNELLPPGSKPSGCRIVDANSPMLDALVHRDGGVPINPGIVQDDPEAILDAMRDDVDVVLVSGGSSVGQEDHAPRLLAAHGELAIHGVAMRPSSPAGMGLLDHRLVFLLPGNPVSCLCAYDFFGGRAVRVLAGRNAEWPYRRVQARLRRKLVSAVGRVDYARVKLVADEVEPLAVSGASVLSSTTRADGFVVVPNDSEGYPPNTEVGVWLYDRCAESGGKKLH
jgi:molybdopterin molybdotransferase